LTVALTRFRRTLKLARLEVRALTHTLHLPPALSEIYGGPRPEWLRDILDYLPRLQSLIVSKLPFFDHNATYNLRVAEGTQSSHAYNLRLLLAEREPNSTSLGIARALYRFPALVYLDLSYTLPAKDRQVLAMLHDLSDLQVLKLRGIGLRDADAEFLANAIKSRVRVLDIRNNMLTDMAVRSLMQACFLPERVVRSQSNASGRSRNDHVAEVLRRPDLGEKFLELLTRPLTGRSVIENLPHVGITHLYISDNQLTVEGIAGLLASKRLHLLDAGTVDTVKLLTHGQSPLSPTAGTDNVHLLPGAEKLAPIIGIFAKENLTYLRLHHAVVTKDAPSKEEMSLSDLLPEMPADELGINHFFAELDVAQEIHELPGDAPVYELADTAVEELPTNHSISASRREQYQDEPLPPRRGSIFAPETVEDLGDSSNNPDQHDLDSNNAIQFAKLRAQKVQELLAKRPKNQVLPLRRGNAAFPYLHPSHIPHVKTLVLTDVPSHVPADSPIISSLTRFITACSDETLLAKLQAKADYSIPPGRDRAKIEHQRAASLFALKRLVLEITPVSTTSEPQKLSAWRPQQRDHTDWKSSTGDVDSERLWSAAMEDFSFFGNEECGVPDFPDEARTSSFPMAALNQKVHLISDDESTYSSLSELEAPRSSHESSRKPSPQLLSPSSLGGGGGGGRISHDSNEARQSSTISPRSSPTPNTSNPVTKTTTEPKVDLVSILATFRRTRKSRFEDLQKADRDKRRETQRMESPILSSPSTPTSPHALPTHVEGHWTGEVNVVRNAEPKGRTGVVDIFGNYFENGYLYP
jgi:hypothetical protein